MEGRHLPDAYAIPLTGVLIPILSGCDNDLAGGL
jgi:hypothetical protein